GRLRVGAKRYRELLAMKETPPTAETAKPLTVAVVGAVKAGKSSLINTMLGDDRAAVDVVPLTSDVTGYELKTGELPPLRLLDTPGYGADGPDARELKAAFTAAKEADLILFTATARSAARKGDIDFLARLAAAFASEPALKHP